MKTQPGFEVLVDREGNRISVSASKAAQLVKAGGWRREQPPPPKKPKTDPQPTGSE